MALNLSTLTSPATSGDVLAEALTTADFLEPVPVLRNLARSSNRGSDAKQDVALNQPKALPLIKNPAGDLGGYLYIPNVAGNYATGPSVTIGSNQTWEGELDMVVTQFGNFIQPMGGGFWTTGFGLLFSSSAGVRVFSKGVGPVDFQPSGITVGTSFNVKYGYDGSVFYADINGVRKFTTVAPSQSGTLTETLQLSSQNNLSHSGNYAIQKAKLTVNSAVVFDCDFNGSTSIRHGDTKFQAAVGGDVTLTRAGNDPATVIKKPVLRFDGVNDFMDGLLNQTVTDGYMFAAFSVLGDGGSEGYGRILGLNSTGSVDSGAGGVAFRRNATTTGLMIRYNENNITTHSDFFDDERGDYLLEAKVLTGSQKSKINNADLVTGSVTGQLNAEEFGIAAITNGGGNRAAIDLEYLALFDASITDAQADAVRNFINNRNTVFLRHDTDGYYFYDAQKAPVGNISSGSASWNGRIVGSDNGDTDKLATQATANDQPVSDGYVVTFADDTDHLEIPQVTLAAGDSYAWMVCGTSLGTFAYKVTVSGETELNLLGHLGDATFRKAGDLYGIILLPESATGRDIEQARKLLIDRGAADGASTVFYTYAWRFRTDIEDFRAVDMSVATSVFRAWDGCSSMTSFGVTELSNCANFTNAWLSCSALTSFPADAKLGTEANNVNFTSAWRSSGLTSFSTPLPTGTNFVAAWRDSASLALFSSDLSSATDLNQAFRGCSSLTDLTLTGTSSVVSFEQAFIQCNSLTTFPSIDISSSRIFLQTWFGCNSLVDFPENFFSNWNPSSITSGVFNLTWDGCTSLTAQSVENILVSIAASGQFATVDGNSGSAAIADAGIDIDYNGDPLSAATTAAIDSLSGKGWQVYINGELVIPNILDLEPAAAYSLRSFDADADPNVVNVRRSSDGATSDFTASEVSDGTLVAWVGAGNDGHVTTWYDQSSNGLDSSQSTASAQPKIVDGGTLVTEGGLAAVAFDGAGDSLLIPAGLISSLSNILVSVVFTGSDGNNDYGVVLGEPNSRIYVPIVHENDLNIGYDDGFTKLVNGPYVDGLQIATLSVDDTTASGFYNSSAFSNTPTATASSSPPVITTNANRIGSYGTLAYSALNFSEIVIFNTDQSSNRTGIENNINDHFDIYS